MQAIINAIESGSLDADVKVVISNKPDAPGLSIATDKGITTQSFPISDYDSKQAQETAMVACLKKHGVQLVVLAGYMRLIGDPLLEGFPNAIVNIHPSLLPSFKGLNAQKQALDYGVKYTGCTVHYVIPEMDAGPIILQDTLEILANDTEKSLVSRLLEKEHAIYPKAIQLIAESRVSLDGNKVVIR
jgi:phosphoribosylglycinamide formyltransferase 1